MEKYNHKKIEARWHKRWQKEKLYKTAEDKAKPKYYVLDMFPYPSGAGLHVGHPKGFIATDIFARAKMMQGYNVLHPMGWDAFGLPAENYAIANKIHPRVATEKNIKTFKTQLEKLGFTYDWEREINTTDPEYYKWTQWTFIKMFERGLADESNEPVNWCPSCKTVLSNEDLEDGKCERCGSAVERKPMRQWVLKITDYADRLLKDLEKLPDWEESIKEMQRNWIGRSEGAMVKFPIAGSQSTVEVYTTRIDTIFSGTYVILAPEHKFLEDNKDKINNWHEVYEYILKSKNVSDIERTAEGKDWSGVEIKGIQAINPATNKKMPIWVADFVLGNYGTGAVFADAHDARDFYLAKKYNIPLKVSIAPDKKLIPKIAKLKECFAGEGILFNSNQFDGLMSAEARPKIISWLKEKGLAEIKVNYKLRNWVFSRQRYWGEPIPIVHCQACKNRKYNFIFIHGYSSNGSRGWRPWLKKYLEEKGHRVFSPDLPNTDKPSVDEQADYIIKKAKIDKDTILIGGSLGGTVALRILEKIKGKIAKAIFVDPVVFPEFNDRHRPAVKVAHNWKFDYKKIKKSSVELVILGDKNFPIITKEQLLNLSQALDAPLIMAEPKTPHFKGAEEPEILKIINNNGVVSVPYEELPLRLPEVKNYQPTGTGESPLANIKDWVNTKCPRCGGPAKRETNTMPQWAGSSWYYLRYIDPHNKNFLVDKTKEKYWSPVDFYVGGAEHAARHLIYARFWHKFLFDIGAVNYDEPFTRLRQVGLILAEDGRKMSKRWHNVINPDEIVEKFGADAMRVYEMFMGPFKEPCAWSTNGLLGGRRFLENVYKLKDKKLYDCRGGDCQVKESGLPKLLHQTIKKVSQDIENFHYNTAISQMMIFVNFAGKFNELPRGALENFLKILAPFAPHLAEELWSELGHKQSIFKEKWPKYNPELVKDETINLVIQVNGKVRDTLKVSVDISEEEAKKVALESQKIKKWLLGEEVKKVIFVKGKLVNIVI